MKKAALGVLLSFLVGCQNFVERDENSPFYMVPSGSRLLLHYDVMIPPYKLKTYIQNGRIVYAPNQYYPFCRFELRQVKETPQRVTPDIFEIYQTSRQKGIFAAMSSFQLFASLTFGNSGDGKPSPIIYATRMDLRSSQQPEVFRLTCGHLQDPNLEARHLSIKQIREALGNVFTLQLPPEKTAINNVKN